MLFVLSMLVLAATPEGPHEPTLPVVREPTVVEPGGGLDAGNKPEPSDAGLAMPSKSVEKAPPEPAKRSAGLPSLSRKALCGEITRTAKELERAREKLEAEKATLASERATLEARAKELETARAALKEETAHLESLLGQAGAQAPPRAAEKTRPPPQKPVNKEVDGLARTLKAMKPEAAAALLTRTEPTLAASILKRMKPNDAGQVIDKLKPELAAELLATMATLPSAPAAGRP